MANPLERLASMTGEASDVARDHLDAAPSPLETPDQTNRRLISESQQTARLQREASTDYAQRGIPTFKDTSGNIQPVRDGDGAALTHFDKRNNVAYDSTGAPKSLSYGETGAPELVDPYASAPTTVDPKTGHKYKVAPGLPWKWEGTDPELSAAAAAKERDKAIGIAVQHNGRKLSLEESELTTGERRLKREREALQQTLPAFSMPEAQAALDAGDVDTALKYTDAHFDELYQGGDANKGFFQREFSGEQVARRAQIDQDRAAAHKRVLDVVGLSSRLGALRGTVDQQRAMLSGMVDARAEHALGQLGFQLPQGQQQVQDVQQVAPVAAQDIMQQAANGTYTPTPENEQKLAAVAQTPEVRNSFLQEIGRGAVRGWAGSMASLGGLMRMAGMEESGAAVSEFWDGVGQNNAASSDVKTFDPASPQWWAARLPEVTAGFIPQIAVGLATQGASLPVQLASFGVMGGGIMAGDTYNEAVEDRIQRGESPEQARDGAIGEAAVVGGIGAALESIPGMAFFSKNPVLHGVLGKVIKNKVAQRGVTGFTAEAFTELGQEIVTDFAALGYRDDAARFKDAYDRWAASFLLGGVMGAGVGIALHGNEQTTGDQTLPPADQTPPPEAGTGGTPQPVAPGQALAAALGVRRADPSIDRAAQQAFSAISNGADDAAVAELLTDLGLVRRGTDPLAAAKAFREQSGATEPPAGVNPTDPAQEDEGAPTNTTEGQAQPSATPAEQGTGQNPPASTQPPAQQPATGQPVSEVGASYEPKQYGKGAQGLTPDQISKGDRFVGDGGGYFEVDAINGDNVRARYVGEGGNPRPADYRFANLKKGVADGAFTHQKPVARQQPAPTNEQDDQTTVPSEPQVRQDVPQSRQVPVVPEEPAAPAQASTPESPAPAGPVEPATAPETNEASVDSVQDLVEPQADTDTKAHEAATSPSNDRTEPTEAQKKAGNYKVGRVTVSGLPISIENPEGSKRSGKDASGTPWEVDVKAHYGYIRRTEGVDGDQVDVFIKPGTQEDWDGAVYVINQVDPSTRKFDEHKVVLGASSAMDAQSTYLRNYAPGWNGLGSVKTFKNVAEFKAWLPDAKKSRPRFPVPTGQGVTVTKTDDWNNGANRSYQIAAGDNSGNLTLSRNEDGTWGVEMVTVAKQGQGLGAKAYTALHTQLATEGSGLTSGKPGSLSAPAKKLWARLVANGQAEAVDGPDGTTYRMLSEAKPTDKNVSSPKNSTVEAEALTQNKDAVSPVKQAETAAPKAPAPKPEAPKPQAQQEITEESARATVERALAEIQSEQGIEGLVLKYGNTGNDSGLAFNGGKILVDLNKLAKTMRDTGAAQRIQGIAQTPEGAVKSALFEEVVHLGQWHVAGKNLKAFYDAKPDSFFPEGWQDAVKKSRTDWQTDPELHWMNKAEFVRMALQKRWTGTISEEFHRLLKDVLAFLDGVAKTAGKDFQAHVAEVRKAVEGLKVQKAAPKAPKPPKSEPKPKAHPKAPQGTQAGTEPQSLPGVSSEHSAAVNKALDDALSGLDPLPGQDDDTLSADAPRTAQELQQALERSRQELINIQQRIAGLNERTSTPSPDQSQRQRIVSRINELSAALQRLRKGDTLNADAPALTQSEIPTDKLQSFVNAAKVLIDSGITTPDAMARVLDAKFNKRFRHYSESLWDAFGMVRKSLRGSHDWSGIYAKLDGAQEQPAPGPIMEAQPETFPRSVLSAAEDVPEVTRHGDKIPIAAIYDHWKARGGQGTMDEFKANLITENGNGTISLGREDMGIGIMRSMGKGALADALDRSEAKDRGEVFHYVNIRETRAKPPVQDEQSPAAPEDTPVSATAPDEIRERFKVSLLPDAEFQDWLDKLSPYENQGYRSYDNRLLIEKLRREPNMAREMVKLTEAQGSIDPRRPFGSIELAYISISRFGTAEATLLDVTKQSRERIAEENAKITELEGKKKPTRDERDRLKYAGRYKSEAEKMLKDSAEALDRIRVAFPSSATGTTESTAPESSAPVQDIEIGDDVTWSAGGREAQGTVVRIRDGKAEIDYFGIKFVPMEDLTLKKKSQRNINRATMEQERAETAQRQKDQMEKDAQERQKDWRTADSRTDTLDKAAQAAYAKADSSIKKARAEQAKIKPISTGYTETGKAEYAKQQAIIDGAKETMRIAEAYVQKPKAAPVQEQAPEGAQSGTENDPWVNRSWNDLSKEADKSGGVLDFTYKLNSSFGKKGDPVTLHFSKANKPVAKNERTGKEVQLSSTMSFQFLNVVEPRTEESTALKSTARAWGQFSNEDIDGPVEARDGTRGTLKTYASKAVAIRTAEGKTKRYKRDEVRVLQNPIQEQASTTEKPYTQELREDLGVGDKAALDAYDPAQAAKKVGSKWTYRTTDGSDNPILVSTRKEAVAAAEAHKAMKLDQYANPHSYRDIVRVRAGKQLALIRKYMGQGMSEMEAGRKAQQEIPDLDGTSDALSSDAPRVHPIEGVTPEEESEMNRKRVYVLRGKESAYHTGTDHWGNPFSFAMKLEDGTVVHGSAAAHFDLLANIPESVADRVVDGGFVVSGEWTPGGDLHAGLRPNENLYDYYNSPRPSDPEDRLASDAPMPALKIEAVIQRLDPRKGLRWFWEGTADVLDRSGFKALSKAVWKQPQEEAKEKADAWKPQRKALAAHAKLSKKDQAEAMKQWSLYFRNQERAAADRRKGRTDKAASREATAKGIYETANAETKALIDAWKETAVLTGQRRIDNNVLVKDGEIYRKMKQMGDRYFPKKLNRKTMKVLADPAKYPVEWEQMKLDLIENENIKDPSEADKYLREHVFKKETDWDFYSSIETARKADMPESWMEYSWNEIVPWYVTNYARRMGQIKAYGQTTNEKKDLWDQTLADIPKTESTEYTQAYIMAAAEAAKFTRLRTPFANTLRFLQTFATGALLSSPFSAVRNMVSGTTQTAVIFGPAEALKQTWNAVTRKAAKVSAQDLGVIHDDLFAMMTDPQDGRGEDTPMRQMLQKVVGKTLRMTGFTLAEEIVRTTGALSAMNFARKAALAITEDAGSAKSAQYMAVIRRMRSDPLKLVAEHAPGFKGQPTETEHFIRQSVIETQGGYTFGQTPLHMSEPTVSFLTQFQKWGTQMARFLAKHAINPMVHGQVETLYELPSGKLSLDPESGGRPVEKKVRSFQPFIYVVAFAILGGEGLYWLKELLTGRKRPDSSFEEVGKSDTDSDKMLLLANRLTSDIIMAGTMGMLTDYAANFKEFSTRGRFKNPLDPPGTQFIKNIYKTAVTGWQQGKLTSRDVLAALASQFPGVAFAERFGKRIAGEDTHVARNDQALARDAGMRAAKALGMPIRAPFGGDMPVKSPNTPFYNELQNALLTGNGAEVRALVNERVKGKTMAEREKMMKGMRSSVSMGAPLRIGGFASAANRLVFLSWAQKNLPAADLKRVKDLDRRYWSAATSAGLAEGEPTPREMPSTELFRGFTKR